MSVLIEHFAAATAAHCAGRREAGVMAEAVFFDNPQRGGPSASPTGAIGAAERDAGLHGDRPKGTPCTSSVASPPNRHFVIAITNRMAAVRD
jgi:hypothetical protein